MTRISDFVLRGTQLSRERNYLRACVVTVFAYVGSLLWFQHVDKPFDKVFFGQREAVRIMHVQQHPIKLDAVLSLVMDGHLTPTVALLDGWSVPESWGVWSDQSSAALAFSVPPGVEGALQLEISARLVLDDRGLQTIRVFADGFLLGSWQLQSTVATLRTYLPRSAISPSHIVRLTFEIGHPRQAPHSSDPRQLGIGIVTLAVCSHAGGE